MHLIKYNKLQALINLFFKLFDKNIPIQCAIYFSPKFQSKIDEIINKVKNAGMEIYDISTDEGNLEDVFIDLTKS